MIRNEGEGREGRIREAEGAHELGIKQCDAARDSADAECDNVRKQHLADYKLDEKAVGEEALAHPATSHSNETLYV